MREAGDGACALRCSRCSLALGACSWFTDFKQQPKIDPWESPADTIPPRGNPQRSVPIYGSAAPGFHVRSRADAAGAHGDGGDSESDRRPTRRSVNRWPNSVSRSTAPSATDPLGLGNGPVVKYGMFPPAIGAAANPAAGYTDGYIFGIIRNGKGLMPSYNRIEEPDRWDIVNYLRSLQGKIAIAADTSHGRPGETGANRSGCDRRWDRRVRRRIIRRAAAAPRAG